MSAKVAVVGAESEDTVCSAGQSQPVNRGKIN